ncbi:MAG: ATPase involved in chromosome partitioning [Clostridia bacterium]|jgi:flagellar biosynthesis protein FlhG|nr:ATPase involved in chromosome partitioning [Clostridia bacterium]
MRDQAEKLREIINDIKSYSKESASLTAAPPAEARVITITSGKGGVGKTNFTVNLAIKLSQMGNRVIIIDADLGLSNVDVIMGKMSKYNLSDVLKNDKEILDILEEGPCGVRFVSGGSGVQDLVKLNKMQLVDLLMKLGKLDYEADIILIDTGAGLSDSVLSFVHASKEVILVTTPEPTSITDAYALIKTISNKDAGKNIKIVVNKVESEIEANHILEKLKAVSERFIGMKLISLGFIMNDSCVPKSVKIQQPFVLNYTKCEATKNITDIANILLDTKGAGMSGSSGLKMFINKLSNIFS